MRRLHVGLGDAEESCGPAVDRDQQHLFTAPLQSCGPITQALDGEPEVPEERGVAKNHGVPANGSNNTHRVYVVELLDRPDLNIAFAGAFDNSRGETRLQTLGHTRSELEKG